MSLTYRLPQPEKSADDEDIQKRFIKRSKTGKESDKFVTAPVFPVDT